MVWQFNPFAIVLIVSAVIAGALSLSAYNKRSLTPAARPFVLMMAFVAIWCFGYAIELSGAGYRSTYLGVKIAYAGVVSVPVLFLLFTIEYGGMDKYISKRSVAFLFMIPACTLLLNWTSPLHHLYYKSDALDSVGNFVILTIVPGPWFWVQIIYSYTCLLTATVVLILKLRGLRNLYRDQLILILAGVIFPWAGNALDNFARPFHDVNVGPLSLVVMGVLLWYALFRKRLLDVIPVARDTIIESRTDGVMVIDAEERIVDINCVMLKMLPHT